MKIEQLLAKPLASEFFLINHVEAEQTSKPSDNHPNGQKYKTVSLEKIRPELAGLGYGKVISSKKPMRISFFADVPANYENAVVNNVVEGNVVSVEVEPYYVNDETGKPRKYSAKFPVVALRDKPIVATSVKFFLFAGEDLRSAFRQAKMRAMMTKVPQSEISVYADYLTVTAEGASEDMEIVGA